MQLRNSVTFGIPFEQTSKMEKVKMLNSQTNICARYIALHILDSRNVVYSC